MKHACPECLIVWDCQFGENCESPKVSPCEPCLNIAHAPRFRVPDIAGMVEDRIRELFR